MIKLNNINLKYDDKIIFDKFSLNIKDNSSYYVSGVIGKGKTSLLNVISGFENKYSGKIEYESFQMSDIYYSLFYPFYVPWFTMEENINNFLKVDKHQLSDYFDRFDVKKYIKSYPKEVNRGIIKKFDLIRMFLSEKKILLIDEPFCFLDEISNNNIKKQLSDFQFRKNKIILIAGNDNSIKMICDEVIRL